jgi:hypothetical protein
MPRAHDFKQDLNLASKCGLRVFLNTEQNHGFSHYGTENVRGFVKLYIHEERQRLVNIESNKRSLEFLFPSFCGAWSCEQIRQFSPPVFAEFLKNPRSTMGYNLIEGNHVKLSCMA